MSSNLRKRVRSQLLEMWAVGTMERDAERETEEAEEESVSFCGKSPDSTRAPEITKGKGNYVHLCEYVPTGSTGGGRIIL